MIYSCISHLFQQPVKTFLTYCCHPHASQLWIKSLMLLSSVYSTLYNSLNTLYLTRQHSSRSSWLSHANFSLVFICNGQSRDFLLVWPYRTFLMVDALYLMPLTRSFVLWFGWIFRTQAHLWEVTCAPFQFSVCFEDFFKSYLHPISATDTYGIFSCLYIALMEEPVHNVFLRSLPSCLDFQMELWAKWHWLYYAKFNMVYVNFWLTGIAS